MMHIRALDAPLGAEVADIDLAAPLSNDAVAILLDALFEYLVLVFPDQQLDDAQHVDFARHWGELQVHVLNQYRHGDRPEIYMVTNLDENGRSRGEHPDPGAAIWHSDGSWSAQRGLVTMLHAQRLPAKGGDTLFANMYAAYEGLSDADKALIEHLKAVHDLAHSRRQTVAREQLTDAQKIAAPPVEWPLVRTHPETGRKCLYLGQHASHIAGMSLGRGRILIQRLNEHATQPQYVYRHVWKPNQFVMWDNRAVLHSATDFDWINDVRVLRRTTTVGERIVSE